MEDIEIVVSGLRERGLTFEEYDLPQLKTVNGIAELPGGVKVAWFKDPKATSSSLFSRRPRRGSDPAKAEACGTVRG